MLLSACFVRAKPQRFVRFHMVIAILAPCNSHIVRITTGANYENNNSCEKHWCMTRCLLRSDDICITRVELYKEEREVSTFTPMSSATRGAKF